MTVAAIVRPADTAEALLDAAGRPAVRRIVDSAWAGGALPIIVVADDADGAIGAVLNGSPAILVSPPAGADGGAYGAGLAASLEAVQGTTAALLWPGRMIWVDPETVTSLIEAHGQSHDGAARPVLDGRPGWPILLPATGPTSRLEAADAEIDDPAWSVADGMVLLDLGDPGSVIGREVSLEDLPGYRGPGEPVSGPPPEWGSAAADTPEPEAGT